MHISFKLFISAAVIDTFSAPNNRRHASATICHSRPLVATVTGVWRGEEGANRKGTFVTAIASRHNPTCPLPLSLCLSLSLSLFHKDWIFDKPALTVFYWPSKSLSLFTFTLTHTHEHTHFNFLAVNIRVSSQALPVWGQSVESQWEAVEKSSFVMRAQREPRVIMTEETNKVCSPPLPATPLTPGTRLCCTQRLKCQEAFASCGDDRVTRQRQEEFWGLRKEVCLYYFNHIFSPLLWETIGHNLLRKNWFQLL